MQTSVESSQRVRDNPESSMLQPMGKRCALQILLARDYLHMSDASSVINHLSIGCILIKGLVIKATGSDKVGHVIVATLCPAR